MVNVARFLMLCTFIGVCANALSGASGTGCAARAAIASSPAGGARLP